MAVRMWSFHNDPWWFDLYLRNSQRFPDYCLKNISSLKEEQQLRRQQLPLYGQETVPYPADFMRPVLHVPDDKFIPDYIDMGRNKFFSRRLREVVDLPEDAIQYLPIDSVGCSKAFLSQDYKLAHVLVQQAAMDRERSRYVEKSTTYFPTGEKMKLFRISSYVVREDFQPEADIILASESANIILIRDELAGRVMDAGCTGMSFVDPETPGPAGGPHPYRTRTRDGIHVIKANTGVFG